ncbi:MAG: flagellar motor protein MotA [Moraxellaceae bacterium]|nr:MAG: flagellar motor protein MotA [Moraxellaceae bacterium]
MPTTTEAATESSTSFVNIVVSFFAEGGPFMYIIFFVFLVGMAISLERFIYLNLTQNRNQAIWKKLFPLLTQGNFKAAMDEAKTSSAAIGKILSYGLSRSAYATRTDEIEMAMEEGLLEAIPSLERRTHYIATFANIATLLGLLGTIMGLINAFTAVANADPAQKADLLSASISVAMNTTAFGLMAAIPLLLTFAYLQSKTNQLVDSMEMASVKFLNVFRQVQQAKKAQQTKSA